MYKTNLCFSKDCTFSRFRTNSRRHPCANHLRFQELMIMVHAEHGIGLCCIIKTISNRIQETVRWIWWSHSVIKTLIEILVWILLGILIHKCIPYVYVIKCQINLRHKANVMQCKYSLNTRKRIIERKKKHC